MFEAVPTVEIWVVGEPISKPRISKEDQRDLKAYHREQSSSYCHDASPLGIQLDNAKMFSQHARPCTKCGGNRKKHIGGRGWISSEQSHREQRKLLKLLGISLPPAFDIACKACGCSGWLPGGKRRARGPLTARPTGSSVKGNGVPETGGNDSMELHARVDRKLARVRMVKPVIAEAIGAWFSEDGGTIAALWHLTPAGRTMLHENGRGLPQHLFFQNLRNAQKDTPTEKRQLQFDAADQQSRELYEEFHTVWVQVNGGGGKAGTT